MRERLKERFEFINVEEIWPYLENVMVRLPDKEREELFKNKKIEVISVMHERGSQIHFRAPIKSLICLNWAVIAKLKTDPEKRYGIAHEIAHHFAGRGRTGLREKEALDKMREWGSFDDEIEAANHKEPIWEARGYEIGYEWATNHLSPSDEQYLPNLRYFVNKWENDELTSDDSETLRRVIKPRYIFDEFYANTPNGVKDKYNETLEQGIVFGVMRRVQQLEGKSARTELGARFRER
jgi:hypothetical protein